MVVNGFRNHLINPHRVQSLPWWWYVPREPRLYDGRPSKHFIAGPTNNAQRLKFYTFTKKKTERENTEKSEGKSDFSAKGGLRWFSVLAAKSFSFEKIWKFVCATTRRMRRKKCIVIFSDEISFPCFCVWLWSFVAQVYKIDALLCLVYFNFRIKFISEIDWKLHRFDYDNKWNWKDIEI